MKPPLPQAAMLGLCLIAFALRTYCLNCQSLWIDEAWTLYFAHLSQADLWHYLRTTEPHPPLYFPVINMWVKVIGESEYALRFYSVIFSLLCIPLTYRLGRALSHARVGLIAASLMTLAPFQIWHAQDARMYSQLTATCLLSLWAFMEIWLERQNFPPSVPPKGREVLLPLPLGEGWGEGFAVLSNSYSNFKFHLLYLLGTLAAILTHYHGLIVIGIQGLFIGWLLLRPSQWRTAPRLAAPMIIVVLLYIPWLWFSWELLKGRTSWLTQPTLLESYSRSLIAYTIGQQPAPPATWLPLLMALLYIIGLARTQSRDSRAFLFIGTLAPIFVTWLYGAYRTPIYYERYLIMVQPLMLITMSNYSAMRSKKFLTSHLSPLTSHLSFLISHFLLLIAYFSLLIFYLNLQYHDPVYAKENWRGVAAKITAFGQPNDGILLTGDGGELAFNYYYHGPLPVDYPFNITAYLNRPARPDTTTALSQLSDLANQHERLWYSPYGMELDPALETWLNNNAYPAWYSWLGTKRLALYGSPSLATPRHETINQLITDDLILQIINLVDKPIAANKLLPLQLTWHINQPLGQNYQLSWRLTNELGDMFAQNDQPLTLPPEVGGTEGGIPSRHALWIPVDAPPGHYTLQLIVYDGNSGQGFGAPILIPNIMITAATITPPLTAIDRPNPMVQNLGDFELVGYALPESVQPGQPMWAWLYWRLAAPTATHPPLTLQLGTGNKLPQYRANLSDSVGAVESWRIGQVRRAVYHLPTSSDLSGDTAPFVIMLNGKTTILELTLQKK